MAEWKKDTPAGRSPLATTWEIGCSGKGIWR
jgi:hypothetical protein